VPLFGFGEHHTGLDKQHAHKITLAFNLKGNTFYMDSCAIDSKGRTITP
jgi:hypothetical protein